MLLFELFENNLQNRMDRLAGMLGQNPDPRPEPEVLPQPIQRQLVRGRQQNRGEIQFPRNSRVVVIKLGTVVNANSNKLWGVAEIKNDQHHILGYIIFWGKNHRGREFSGHQMLPAGQSSANYINGKIRSKVEYDFNTPVMQWVVDKVKRLIDVAE